MRQAEAGCGAYNPKYNPSSRHVVLHLVHLLAGFDRYAAAVERDALADDGEGEGVRLVGVVFENDEAGRLGTAARHAQHCAHAHLFHLRQIEYGTIQAVGFRHLLRQLREVGRRHITAGPIDYVAGHLDGVHDLGCSRHSRPRLCSFLVVRTEERAGLRLLQLLQLLGLVLLEAVRSEE